MASFPRNPLRASSASPADSAARAGLVDGRQARRAWGSRAGGGTGATPRPGHRAEVQALRALAVALVVAFHVAPDAVPGGYVGVDVFFVISGFLITGGLLREIEATGTVALLGFWARRVRRLLPASLLVIAACAIAVPLLVPVGGWEPMLAELWASALYIENRQLASSAVDYFAAGDLRSPVRHFWSLSVEEQFYLVWPLVLLAVALLVPAARPVMRRRAVVATIALVAAASFAWALMQVAAEPGAAYFSTAARAWEFGAGALLATVTVGRRPTALLATLASWAGLAAIVGAAMAYGEATPFPGVAALLPVLGAVAVIWAGLPVSAWAPTRGFTLRPVQRLGAISYGVYLWHWPLLIFAPFALGGALGAPELTLAVAATLGLAWATERWVEEPVRRGTLVRRPAWMSLAAAVAGTAAVLAIVVSGDLRLDGERRTAQQATRATLAARPVCFGAAARDAERPCRNPALERAVVPAPVEARGSRNAPCEVVERLARLSVCAFGPSQGTRGTVAVLGDSHAAHWRGAVEEVAKAEGWRGISLTYTGCPLSTGLRAVPAALRSLCNEFRRETYAWLERHPEVSTVFVAALAGGSGVVTRGAEEPFDAAVDGYVGAWRRLPSSVRRIVVLRDNPKAGKGTAACVQRALDTNRPAGEACAIARDEALDPDPSVEAARRVGAPRVQVADLTELFCDPRVCFPVVGGALVHRDQDHLTPLFAQTLGPPLRRMLARMRYTVSPTA